LWLNASTTTAPLFKLVFDINLFGWKSTLASLNYITKNTANKMLGKCGVVAMPGIDAINNIFILEGFKEIETCPC
jgi:hypothetical protein